MRIVTDEEILKVAEYRCGQPSMLIDKDDLLELLRERQLLREALTFAQDRCGRLNEERVVQNRKIAIGETVLDALNAECRRLSDENRDLRRQIDADEAVHEAIATEMSRRDDTEYDDEGGTGTLDPSDR